MSATVLVIEDDEMVADLVRAALAPDGYSLVHAPNGEAGLSAVADESVDVVLFDLGVHETDPWGVLSRLRTHADDTDLPIIVLSTRAMPADKVRGYNLGATAYLSKPFTAAELSEKVRDAVADASHRPQRA